MSESSDFARCQGKRLKRDIVALPRTIIVGGMCPAITISRSHADLRFLHLVSHRVERGREHREEHQGSEKGDQHLELSFVLQTPGMEKGCIAAACVTQAAGRPILLPLAWRRSP